MSPLLLMLSIPAGLLYANVAEWVLHKHLLHGRWAKGGGFWSFHWVRHHRNARLRGHLDPDYSLPLWRGWNGQTKELAGLALAALGHLPLVGVAPLFYATLLFCTVEYYLKHKRAHLDPEWAKTRLPWHYDHHMGPNPDANWCVVRPWADHLFGTRIPYVGTEREAADRARREARAATPRPAGAAGLA